MTDNNRQFLRKELHLAIEVITENNIYLGTTLDISKNGMAIQMDGPVYEKQNIQIGVFQVADGIEDIGEPFGLTGTVVWSRLLEVGKFGAGIKLDKLTAEEENYLAELLGY